MNIVTIIGSPHGMKGTTGRLLSSVEESFKASGADVKQFVVAGMDVKPCLGCDSCHKTGHCVIEDDFKEVEAALLKADGVVLASPNYIFNVTAQMKALLDRCSCRMHCQTLEGKYGAAVVTSRGSGGGAVEGYLLRFLRALGCWTVGSVAAEAHEVATSSGRAGRFREAGDLGARLVEAIRRRQTFADQEPERTAVFDEMKALVTLRREEWPHEYQYWKSRGRI
jgi:multimeric flavodoxin WrbA